MVNFNPIDQDYNVRWQSDLENTKERPLHKPSKDQSKSTALGGVWNFAERCIRPSVMEHWHNLHHVLLYLLGQIVTWQYIPYPLDENWPCTVINDHDWQLWNCPLIGSHYELTCLTYTCFMSYWWKTGL